MRSKPFSILAKPTGALCNLDCTYCFFLSKESLYDERQRMSEQTLRLFLKGYLDSQPDGDVTIAWQGGEPTLRGLDFFKQAVAIAKELARPGQHLFHTIQTNATLIDESWADFLATEGFLVGVSIDGPEAIHDTYRVNKAGRGTHSQVVGGYRKLQKAGVEINILCTVHAANQNHPLEVYRYFRDTLNARYIQFIPIVERVSRKYLKIAEQGWKTDNKKRLLYRQAGNAVTSRSVEPKAFGAFLSAIWDEWFKTDVGTVFVQHFDTALSNAFGVHSLCVHSPTCGQALAVEHNGDVYSCDHYVEPGYLLGNVATDPLAAIAFSPFQLQFGQAKSKLTKHCQQCPVRWACFGGCPKDRFAKSPDGEYGQNYLCAGYYDFFSHITPGIAQMVQLIQQGREAKDVMNEKKLDSRR
ncbi:anaerobic sulfatase maturase [Mobiluncus porci]|uniref:Anaerobic sulfatase maturase n=1 Tax=Mobiluncus porci TaxID=2652278 RepID=A0A7K0K0U2_9ACTO|nr:anaerobic sulfatase maturase [Mobiluncus porci]MST49117.1 anaerobic sulfatase maturase [Mobiluncus porci]